MPKGTQALGTRLQCSVSNLPRPPGNLLENISAQTLLSDSHKVQYELVQTLIMTFFCSLDHQVVRVKFMVIVSSCSLIGQMVQSLLREDPKDVIDVWTKKNTILKEKTIACLTKDRK